MLRRFGGAGTDLFSTAFQKVLIEAQEPDYYDDFKTEPLGNGAPAAIEVLYALGNSDEGELKDFYATLENSLKDEMWTMTDEQLVDVLKVVCPYLIHKTLQFLGEIPLKKLSKIPAKLFNVLIKDPKLMQMMSFTLRRQAAETNVQFFRAVVKDPIQLALKGETSKERLEGLKQLAEIIGDSEIVFRHFSSLCALYYMQSKSSRWASLYRETMMKVKENQSGLTKFRDLFDLTSEISNCLRKKEISSASILLVRKQLEKLIQQQANFEERDYRQKVEEFNKKNGLTEGIKDKLLALWRLLKTKDTYNIFADPVTEAIAPNYFSIIKRPMDLSTIQSKIMKGNYQTVLDMSNDVQLMLSNCMVYNKNTTWADYASDLRAKWDYICKNSSGQGTTSTTSNANKMGKATPTVSVRPDKVFGRAREAAAAAAKKSTNKKKAKQKYDSDASAGDDSDNDDDDDDESVIAQGHKMMVSKKSTSKAADSAADEDDEDSYVGPASRQRPERTAKKRRIVEDSSDEEGVGAHYMAQNTTHADSSDEEAFQPRTPLEKKMLKMWNFVDRSDTRHIFLNRVTDDVAPNYSQVVRTPMYLTLIKSKMAKGEYTDIEQFHKDINLIFSNCIFYNGDTSDLGKFAGQMRDKYHKFVEKEENPAHRASKSGNNTTTITATSGLPSLKVPKNASSDGHASSSGSLKNLLSLLWKKLVDLDTFSYFLNAVSDEIAPGYSEEIEQPMYLLLMKKKISRGEYKNIDAFHEDVNLIVNNCIIYNGDDSDLAATAEEFRDNYFTFFQQDVNVQAQVAALQHSGGVTPANASGVPLSHQVSTSRGDSALQDLLLDVWTKVVSMDVQGIFLDKVTNKTAPNYSSIIRRPMYLLLMKEKILQGEYRRVEDFSADVKLIVENCKKYNGPDSSFAKYAQEFGNKYLALSKTLPKTSTSSVAINATLATPTAYATTANTRNAAANSAVIDMEETEDSLMKRIKEAWLLLHEKDTYKLFMDPISDTIAPGYSKKIKHPMCLSDMKTKAKSKSYRHFNAFADDVRTMFNNCAIYNGKDSEVAVYGQSLLKDFEQYIAKSKPQYKKSAVLQAQTSDSGNLSSSFSSGPDLKTIKNSILEAIESIRAADNLAIFEDKVTLQGYSRVVKKPMYAKLMEEKAKNMSYRKFQDFHADVILMFDNCNLFNKGNVQILQYADTVKASYEVTKAQLMATKLAVAPSIDKRVSATNSKTNNSTASVNSSSTSAATAAAAVTPTAPKQFPPKPTEFLDLVAVDSPHLQNLQERLKRETYVPITQIYATAQRVVHTRQHTMPEMRFIHKTFVDEILFPMQEYSSLVPIDSTEETMLIRTYLPQHNINKLKVLRPENAMFGTNITKLNEVLSAAVEFLMKLDTPSKFFREIPTDAIAPDYSKLVKYPMAIFLLREKVRHSAYRSITDFHEDVLYIGKNCLDYNGMDSVVSKAAVELIVRWYVYFGFMVHFYPFLCRSSPSNVPQSHNTNGYVKSPGHGNDSVSGGPSPHVIPKKRRAMSFDEKEDCKNGSSENKNGYHDRVDAGSPPMKKTKTEVSSPSYLVEIESMLSAAAVGHKHDDAKAFLPSIVTVSEDEWRKFIEKLLTKKANASSQKTNIFISKLTELMVPFLRAQDFRKLFTRPLPQAKEVDKSEFMDFATMMVKVDRNKYASIEELTTDVKKMVRNRLITERFISQDTHNTNDFSLYAMGMFTLMSATVELLQAVMTDKVTSLETSLAHVPLYVIKSTSSQSHAVSQDSKIADIVTDTPTPPAATTVAAATGVLGGNVKIMASPPKIRRQISEDGEVLSDDESEADKNASTEEKTDDKNESSMVEKYVVVSDVRKDAPNLASAAITDSKASVMCMDVDDEAKEEFVAPPLVPPQPVNVQQEMIVIAPPKSTLTKSKSMFDTETFDSDDEEVHATAVNSVTENNTTLSESAKPVIVSIAAVKKAAINDIKSLFPTETFDSDEDEGSNNNNNSISEEKYSSQTIAVLVAPVAATMAPPSQPVMTKATSTKKVTDLKKKKPSLGSLFETDAFDSDEDDDTDEKNVDQEATIATTSSMAQSLAESSKNNFNKIRKKIRTDSSDDEGCSSKLIVDVKPPQLSGVKPITTSIHNSAKPAEPSIASSTTSQQARGVSTSTNLNGSGSAGSAITATVVTNNNVALNPPQPSETLLSSRRAVEYLQRLSTALHQHVQGQRESFRTSETHITEPVVSLPGILTVTTLRWSIILLKIAGFQTMLLPLYATEIVSALLSAKDESSSLLYKHQRVLFFTQLCCLGVTNDLLLYGLEGEQGDKGLVATMLREWIPLLLCSILDRNVPECDVETVVTPFFATVKVEPAAVTDTTAAAPAKEAPVTGADKDKCVKFLTDLRAQLVNVWKEKSSSLEI